MNAATYFDSFLLQIKLATNRDCLQDISYRAMIHPGTTAQQASMITSLCVYRENIINGMNDEALADAHTKSKSKNATKNTIWRTANAYENGRKYTVKKNYHRCRKNKKNMI